MNGFSSSQNEAPITGTSATHLEHAKVEIENNPQLRAMIQTDGTVSDSRVMHALDVLRQAGISRVALGFSIGPLAKIGESQR